MCGAEAAARLRSAARMAAWRLHAYGAPPDLRLEAARLPALHAPDRLLVRVHAAALNPIDVAMLGGYGARLLNAMRALAGAAAPEFPLVPGREFVGEVARAGPAARLRRGARVWGAVPPHAPGALADYVAVRECWAGPAPERLGAAAGGALYAALSATAALRAAGLWGDLCGAEAARGARVLLLGLGGVGQAALQLLAARGARVLVACARDQHELAARLGAVAAVDRHAPDYDEQLEEAGPYHSVIDAAGLGGGEAGARRWRFGRYVTLSSPLLRETDARGLVAGAAAAAAALAAHNARAPPAPHTPSTPSTPPPRVRWAFFAPRADDIAALRRLADCGEFRVEVEREYGWWAARAAVGRAGAGHARGKLLLHFGPSADRLPDAPP